MSTYDQINRTDLTYRTGLAPHCESRKHEDQSEGSARTRDNLPESEQGSEVNTSLPAGSAVDWLLAGWADIVACRFISLGYGACFLLMGLGIERAQSGNPVLAMALSAGFLFVGPFLAMGLYEISRQLKSSEPFDPLLSPFSWCRNPDAVGRYALCLSAVMIVWLWLSVSLFNSGLADLTRLVIFLSWGALAVAVFMASVVSIPMILDQPVSALDAMSFSFHSCLKNRLAMSVWALSVAVIIGTSLVLGYWLLLLTGPIVGHASWHAYRSLVSH